MKTRNAARRMISVGVALVGASLVVVSAPVAAAAPSSADQVLPGTGSFAPNDEPPITQLGDIDSCWVTGQARCRIDITVASASVFQGGVCDSFDNGSGDCPGSSRGTTGWTQPSFQPRYGMQALFDWTGGNPRTVEYTAKDGPLYESSYIRGKVPNGGSAEFAVTDAKMRLTDHYWRTDSGARPGEVGGPLYIDYDHGFFSTDIHIYGWLVRK